MSLIQKFLREGGTPEELTSRFAIKIKRHSEFKNLLQAKYDQIASPMAEPLVQEARGIVLDEADNWRVVAWPFNKFFNAGEILAARIDWDSAKVLEKLDGSLAIVYYYRDQWRMATSGTPDASGPVGAHGITFRELFWRTWRDLGYHIENLNTNLTYCFELCTAYNRVVVSHAQPRIVLLGVRYTAEKLFGQEIDIHDTNPVLWKFAYDFEVVKTFDHGSLESLINSFDTFDGLAQEGYVVVDSKFNRLKVKHPKYVLFHQMLGSLTPKKLLDAVRRGEMSEVVSYFPEWQKLANELEVKYNALVAEAVQGYGLIRHIPVQKEFALTIKDYPHKSAMFAMRAGKSDSFHEYYRDLRIETLMEMLNVRDQAVDTQD